MRLLILLLCLMGGPELFAKEQEPALTQNTRGVRLERVAGHYKIQSIVKLSENDFQIRFKSEPATGTHDHLVLRSDHVHVSMQEGQLVRLSAEVITAQSNEVEVTQVLLFLSHSEYGTTPVWLLSSQHPTRDFRGSRWLDMHAPQADFLIL